MARDVAQRELDQSGFRISNLGDPAAAGDATKTDNRTIPKGSTRGGFPGSSLLAAPVDHAHPVEPVAVVGSLIFTDLTEQAVSAGAEEVVAEFTVNFAELHAPNMEVDFSAIVKASPEGHFQVRVGGTPGQPDGTPISPFATTSSTFEEKSSVADGATPSGVGLLKITAQAVGPMAVTFIRSKSVILTGVLPEVG